jgi:hypothetical protein
VAKTFKLVAYSGLGYYTWPRECAACGAPPERELTTSASAASNVSLLAGVRWLSAPVDVPFPVCRRHWIIFFVPSLVAVENVRGLLLLVLSGMACLGGFVALISVFHENWGPQSFSDAALAVAFILPFLVVVLSRRLLPVRIIGYEPPILWLRIRRESFAARFRAHNPCEEDGRKGLRFEP